MKKWIKYFIVFIVFMAGLYILSLYYAVPKLAEATIPLLWKKIPLGQKRDMIYEYLGDPSYTVSSKGAFWHSYSNKNLYKLQVICNKDTVISEYRIYYYYKIFGYQRELLLRRDTLQ